jgi:hypothetical protein
MIPLFEGMVYKYQGGSSNVSMVDGINVGRIVYTMEYFESDASGDLRLRLGPSPLEEVGGFTIVEEVVRRMDEDMRLGCVMEMRQFLRGCLLKGRRGSDGWYISSMRLVSDWIQCRTRDRLLEILGIDNRMLMGPRWRLGCQPLRLYFENGKRGRNVLRKVAERYFEWDAWLAGEEMFAYEIVFICDAILKGAGLSLRTECEVAEAAGIKGIDELDFVPSWVDKGIR